jgi:hypothetical protein
MKDLTSVIDYFNIRSAEMINKVNRQRSKQSGVLTEYQQKELDQFYSDIAHINILFENIDILRGVSISIENTNGLPEFIEKAYTKFAEKFNYKDMALIKIWGATAALSMDLNKPFDTATTEEFFYKYGSLTALIDLEYHNYKKLKNEYDRTA